MANVFAAVLSVIDQASAPILKIEENLKRLGQQGAITQKLMTPHQKLFAHLDADLGELGEHFRNVGAAVSEMGSRFGDVMAPLGALAGGGSIAGIVEMTHSFAENAEQLSISAKISGETVQALQAVEFAAKQSGVSTDGLDRSLEMLNKNMGMAGTGKDKNLVALLDHLHISLRDSHGQIESATQVLPKLADAFEHTSDPAMKAAMAQVLFGRAGQELIPLLDGGSKALADYTAQFQKYGYTLSDQDVDAGEKFNETWKDMQAAISGLTMDIGAKLAPVIAPLVQKIADWTAANRDWIASGLQNAIHGIANAVSGINLKTVLADMETFGSDTVRVIKVLGGLEPVIIGVGSIMLASFLAPVVQVTVELGKLAFAMGAPLIGSVVGLGASFVELVPAITSVGEVMTALDIAMDANPLGAAALAVVALAGAGSLLYKNWQPIENFFDKIGRDIEHLTAPIVKFDKAIGLGDTSVPASQLPSGSRFQPRISRPSLFESGSGSSGDSSHTVTINFPNAPPGTTATVTGKGSAPAPKVNMGYSRMSGHN